MDSGVHAARTEMYHDFMSRWELSLDPGVKRVHAIASLLHPGFKDYDFIDGLDFIPASDKAWALRELRTEWRHVWMKPQNQPKVNEATADSAATASSSAAAAATADADAASDAAARVTPGNAPATVALPETTNSVKAGGDAAYTKERKVSLLGLLMKVKSEEPAHVAERDE